MNQSENHQQRDGGQSGKPRPGRGQRRFSNSRPGFGGRRNHRHRSNNQQRQHNQPQGADHRPRPRRPFPVNQNGPRETIPANTPVTGVLEIKDKGYGFLRRYSLDFVPQDSDPFVPETLISKYHLRQGNAIEGVAGPGRRGTSVVRTMTKVNGLEPEEWAKAILFSKGTPIDPDYMITLENGQGDTSMRIVDLLCPVGKGQRALIVAPPRTGKTILLQQMVNAVAKNHPQIDPVVLLIDERPEEVTDMRRNVQGEVFASSNDQNIDNHLRLAQFAMEYVKRKVEAGRDVVLLLDSLTRLGRAFNAGQPSSGRTMSGGVDIGALQIPKKIFGAARNIENGGSLTIIATALIETNSRMDDLIFQEFKGTGNMELVLNRKIADHRIFPAIYIQESGTRKEERLWGKNTEACRRLRRLLAPMEPLEAMRKLIDAVQQTESNQKLLDRLSGVA